MISIIVITFDHCDHLDHFDRFDYFYVFTFRKVVQEYEKTISEIISDRERERVCQEIEKEKLIRERDQATEDLRASERGYYDVHT